MRCWALYRNAICFYQVMNELATLTSCRWITSLNHADWLAQTAQQANQYLAHCERNPRDEVVLNYDARNPFDLCSITFTPIYR